MYNLFNEYISKYDNDNIELEQCWYETDFEPCKEMVSKFSDDDWKMLINSLPTRSTIFKTRLVSCFSAGNNPYQNEIISQLVNIDDIELFMNTLYTINNCDLKLPQETMDAILQKIDYYTPKVSIFKQEVFKVIKNNFAASQDDLNGNRHR